MCMHANSLQPCLTLCDTMDCNPPASSVHGILQAIRQQKIKFLKGGFPGDSVVKNSPANAGDPWSGKIPHVMEQVSPFATTVEPVL